MNNQPNDIYSISKHIQQEQYQREAKAIVNSYRQVQGLKVQKDKNNQIKKEIPKANGTSKYSQKIKQTLKEINAQRTKQTQIKAVTKIQVQKVQIKRQMTRLQKAGVNKVVSVLTNYNFLLQQTFLKCLSSFYDAVLEKEYSFVKKYQLFKIFRAWRDETLLKKLQKRQKGQQDQAIVLQQNQLSKQFYIFQTIKKTFRGWKTLVMKQLKRKQYEKQLRKRQIQQSNKRQIKSVESKVVEKNSELQNKVRGFLSGLKDKMQNKNRLQTIKQKTQQSELRIRQQQISNVVQEQKQEDSNHSQQQFELEQNQSQQQAQNQIQQQIVIVPSQQSPIIYGKKAVTNQQLQKRRKQLQHKHKSRKQMLQKLKKDKQAKKIQQERQRNQLQRQVQLEQKKQKQQQYRLYVKKKQQQQEWQKKQKIYEKKADDFNRKRLMFYYGLYPLKRIKLNIQAKANNLYQSLLLIVYRVKAVIFLQNMQEHMQVQIQNQLEKMDKRWRLVRLKNCLKSLKTNMNQSKQLKCQLTIRHQVNKLKMFFSQWKRVLPSITLQNFDWQRPRIKRAQDFNNIQVINKAFEAIKANRQDSQRQRAIAKQKALISQKIKGIFQPVSINYDQFL